MGNVLPKNIYFSFEKKENITPEETITLSSQIDDIAIHYILKQNTVDLLRLSDKEYYDNLIILTNKIFNDKLSPFEIGALSHKIKGESTIQNAVFNLIPSNEKLKNQMIQNISKYYIKILTIYSAIVSTIDPQYSYEDENGEKQFFYLKDIEQYKSIPRNAQPILSQLSNPMNLCRKRINILKNKLDMNDESFVTINPGEKICDSPMVFQLNDEIGIKELDLLYYDIFDYETKEWSKQSKEMKQKYNKDLTLFYQVFTGNKVKPVEIKSFKDIELLDFKGLNYCNDTFFKKDMIVPRNHHLIQKYLNKIKLIEDSTTLFRQKLISILKQIFLIKSTGSNEPTYMINPDLTMDMILQIENETRDTIIKLYSSCERLFIQAILTFEELYEEQSFNISNERNNNINKNKNITNIPLAMYPNSNQTNIEPLYNQPFNTKEQPQQIMNEQFNNQTKNTSSTGEYNYIPKEQQLFESPENFENIESPSQTLQQSYNPEYMNSSFKRDQVNNISDNHSIVNPLLTPQYDQSTQNPSQYIYESQKQTLQPSPPQYEPQTLQPSPPQYEPQTLQQSPPQYEPQTLQQSPPQYEQQTLQQSPPQYEQQTLQQTHFNFNKISPNISQNKYNLKTPKVSSINNFTTEKIYNPTPIQSLNKTTEKTETTEKPYINIQPTSLYSDMSTQETIPKTKQDISYEISSENPQQLPYESSFKSPEKYNEDKQDESKEDSKGFLGTIMSVFKSNDEKKDETTQKPIQENPSQESKPSEINTNEMREIKETKETKETSTMMPTINNTKSQLSFGEEPKVEQPEKQIEQPKKSFFSVFSNSFKNMTQDNKIINPINKTQPSSEPSTEQIQHVTDNSTDNTTKKPIDNPSDKQQVNPITQL
jgi:hypothetical protein